MFCKKWIPNDMRFINRNIRIKIVQVRSTRSNDSISTKRLSTFKCFSVYSLRSLDQFADLSSVFFFILHSCILYTNYILICFLFVLYTGLFCILSRGQIIKCIIYKKQYVNTIIISSVTIVNKIHLKIKDIEL